MLSPPPAETGMPAGIPQDQLDLRAALESLPAGYDDEQVDEETECEVVEGGGETVEVQTEVIIDVDTGHDGEDRDDGDPGGEIRPCSQRTDHTALVNFLAGVFLIILVDVLNRASDSSDTEGGAHLSEGDVEKEAGQDGQYPNDDAHGPEGDRQIAQRRYDEDRDSHGDDETLFPVDAPDQLVGHGRLVAYFF